MVVIQSLGASGADGGPYSTHDIDCGEVAGAQILLGAPLAAAASASPRFYRPKGCAACHGVGYTGRVGIFELLVPGEQCIDRISHRASLTELRSAAQQAGLRPLRADGIDKVKAGVTSLDELLRML